MYIEYVYVCVCIYVVGTRWVSVELVCIYRHVLCVCIYIYIFICSGNQMGQRGASALAKALLSNCSLTEVLWDHNEMTARGFQEIAAALEQ